MHQRHWQRVVEEQQAEIERLRAELKIAEDRANAYLGRNAIIEECARVAETWNLGGTVAENIAAAIRELKDKP